MTWQEELKHNITTAAQLAQYLPLTEEEQQRIAAVIERYPMSISRYYLSLITPTDPDDPIRIMAVPSGMEMITTEGSFDTSGEQSNTKMGGLQHNTPKPRCFCPPTSAPCTAATASANGWSASPKTKS